MIGRITAVHGDIAEQGDVDAIAAVMPVTMDIVSRATAAILTKGGRALDEYILEHVYRPKAGQIYAIPAFHPGLPPILLAIMPSWKIDFDRDGQDITTCYRAVLNAANDLKIRTLALTPFGTDKIYVFPAERAVRLGVQAAIDNIGALEEVRFVCRDAGIFKILDERLQSRRRR